MKYQIKYQTNKYNKVTEFHGTFIKAMMLYSKIKWENKALWDITNIPELICDNKGTGCNEEFINTCHILNKL